MKNGSNEFIASAVQSQEQSTKLLQKLMAVAKPETVYGAPVTVGMGVGFGLGSGPVRQRGADEGDDGEAPQMGGGGGGGGGGIASGRPVAIITVRPHGVEVTPVIDRTKIVIAALVTLGGMLTMRRKMRKAGHG